MTEPKRILVVDDEALARRRILRHLREAGPPLIVEEAESGLRAVELIHAFRPDVVFLDVEMPGLSGFEVLRQFERRPFQVVFETAYDEFAVRAFEEQACDYLLKPFTADRLLKALARALDRAADEARLGALEAQLAARDGYLRRLTVKQGGRWRVVGEEEVACFVSRDHYTCVHFGDGREAIIDLSLASLSGRLDPRVFQRLHRHSLVRLSAVVSLSVSRQGEMWAELANGLRLPVSRSRRRSVKRMVTVLSP